jgi:rhodanese-related sulfurtransferase
VYDFRMNKLVLVLAIAACSKSPANDQPPPAGHVAGAVHKDPATARQLIAQGAAVLDVRSPDEFAGGHLPQATNMPAASLEVAAVDKLVGGDKSKPVVVYCAKGGRAQKAKDALEAAGYTHVVNGGGYDDLR